MILLCNIWLVSNLNEKSVFITGCDTGFGHALALKLVHQGMTIFAGCLTEKGIENLESAARGASGKLVTIQLDVTNQESVDNALRTVEQSLGPNKGLWALVSNAGVQGPTAPLDWLSMTDWQVPFNVNCLGMIRIVQTFKPLVKRERGRIIIITSLGGRQVVPLWAPYCSSKFASEAYADILRLEMVPFGVTVHIIEPGFMITNLTSESLVDLSLRQIWNIQLDHVKDEYGNEFAQNAALFMARLFSFARSKRMHAVPNACFHAIASRLPNRRYAVGYDCNLILLLTSMPTGIADFFTNISFLVLKYPKRSPRRDKARG